jgi:hypothetical protein
MQAGEPYQFAGFMAITLAGTEVPGLNPAFDGAGVAFDGVWRHAFGGNHRIAFTNPQAHAAIRAPVIIDYRLFLDHFNGIYGAVSHAIPAADAFFLVYIHGFFPIVIDQQSLYD